jgi:DNA-binding NtrC family response regulator
MSLTIPRGHEQVLVIDDDNFIVKILEAFLKMLGYRVLSTTRGVEALQLFLEKKDQISLVILDHTMPDIGGAELAAKLRGARPDIPIIMFSGYDEEDMRRETEKLNITAFMRKPVTHDQLAVTVRKALDESQEKSCAH